jgi:hypothetical protein
MLIVSVMCKPIKLVIETLGSRGVFASYNSPLQSKLSRVA